MTDYYLALVRHGDYQQLDKVPSACQPFPLNDEGRQQVGCCAPELLDFCHRFQVPLAKELHSSSLLRAWQTADIIRQHLIALQPDLITSIVESEQLAERCVGSVANLTVSQIEQILWDDPRYDPPPRNWKADSHYQLPFPGAESLLQAGDRVHGYLQNLMRKQIRCYPKGFLQTVVGHGAAFRHAAYALGVMEYEQIARLSMHHASPVFLQMRSDLSWCHIAGNWKIRQPGDDKID